jgi:DNA end-binding protein Ku
MAPRPSWRGHLRLALVSCPIRLIPATTAKDHIRFHKLNRETGNRLRQQMIDSETGDPVPSDETVMGYEFEKNRYVTVEKEEIDALKIESTETIDIERVVSSSDIDWLYWDTPYLIEPDGKTGADIFATLRDAVKRKKMAAIGRMVMARRERPVLIMPCNKGMVLVTLRDPDEVRKPSKVFEDIPDTKVEPQLLQMAETLLEKMEGKFDLSMFEDRYQEKLHELVEAKMKGQKPVVAEEPTRPSNVVDLFGALKASLEQGGGATAPQKSAPKQASKSKATRKSQGAGTSKRSKSKARKRA